MSMSDFEGRLVAPQVPQSLRFSIGFYRFLRLQQLRSKESNTNAFDGMMSIAQGSSRNRHVLTTNKDTEVCSERVKVKKREREKGYNRVVVHLLFSFKKSGTIWEIMKLACDRLAGCQSKLIRTDNRLLARNQPAQTD